jgi:hypothetical protein
VKHQAPENSKAPVAAGPLKSFAFQKCISNGIGDLRSKVFSEGIETAVGGRMLGFKPVWALGSAGALRSFPVIDGIESLTLMVDNDPADQRGRRAGDEVATECWRRSKDAGREVQAYTTNKPDTDIADIVEGARHG